MRHSVEPTNDYGNHPNPPINYQYPRKASQIPEIMVQENYHHNELRLLSDAIQLKNLHPPQVSKYHKRKFKPSINENYDELTRNRNTQNITQTSYHDLRNIDQNSIASFE